MQYVPAYHSWRVAYWESRLSDASGFKIQIGRLQNDRPGKLTLENLRIVDRESSVSVARAHRATMRFGGSHCQVALQELELESRYLQKQWEFIHHNLLCRPQNEFSTVELSSPQLRLRSGEHEQNEIRNLHVRFTSRPTDSKLTIDFEPEAAEKQLPCQVWVHRFHEEGKQLTQGALLAPSPVSAGLVKHVWPAAEYLGVEARLAGNLKWKANGNGWHVATHPAKNDEAQAAYGLIVENTDFSALTWNMPAAMTGMGTLVLQDAEISSAGLQHLRGAVWSQNGRVSQQLLLEAQSRIGLRLAGSVRQSPTKDIPYRWAGVGFNTDGRQLQLTGLLDGGVLFADGAATDAELAPIAGQPLAAVVSLAEMIPILDARHVALQRQTRPESKTTLPVGRLSRNLLQWMPAEVAERVAENGLQANSNF